MLSVLYFRICMYVRVAMVCVYYIEYSFRTNIYINIFNSHSDKYIFLFCLKNKINLQKRNFFVCIFYSRSHKWPTNTKQQYTATNTSSVRWGTIRYLLICSIILKRKKNENKIQLWKWTMCMTVWINYDIFVIEKS